MSKKVLPAFFLLLIILIASIFILSIDKTKLPESGTFAGNPVRIGESSLDETKTTFSIYAFLRDIRKDDDRLVLELAWYSSGKAIEQDVVFIDKKISDKPFLVYAEANGEREGVEMTNIDDAHKQLEPQKGKIIFALFPVEKTRSLTKYVDCNQELSKSLSKPLDCLPYSYQIDIQK